MTSVAFLLVLFSGLMHALYNSLIKRSRNKTVFIWWLFALSTGLFTLALPLLPGTFDSFDYNALLLAGTGAVCFVSYHLCAARAYRCGDLSVTYPLTQTSMLYIPLWGIWFFRESPSIAGWSGIILVAGGAYLTQLRQLNGAEMVRPFKNLLDGSVQAALGAGVVYSLGAIVDAAGVRAYPPLVFTYLLIVTMLLLMTANLVRSCHRREIVPEWRENRRLILAGAPLMIGSFLSFRYGLALSPMSYAISVRQSSVLAGVLIGIFFLGEPCGRIRVLAAGLILAGICLIRLG